MRPTLNYKTLGQGEPILILHGLFGMMDNWQTIGKRLADAGYMVFLIDQRDHGRSSHTRAFTYALLAEDLLHFMEEHWIHKASILGHSMGGKTALTFLSHNSDMVERLIVVDMGLKRYEDGHSDVFQALMAIDIEALSSREFAEEVLTRYLKDQGTVQFLLKNLTRKKEGGFTWKMNLPLLYSEYKNILAAVEFEHPCDVPACFIRGGKSNYVVDEDIDQIRMTLPQSSFFTIPEAGHWVHADQPDELFHLILNCMRGSSV